MFPFSFLSPSQRRSQLRSVGAVRKNHCHSGRRTARNGSPDVAHTVRRLSIVLRLSVRRERPVRAVRLFGSHADAGRFLSHQSLS